MAPRPMAPRRLPYSAGPPDDLYAGDDWQQRPVGTRKKEEAGGTDERGAQMRVVASVPQANHHRADEGLRRQCGLRARRALPPDECPEDADVAERIDPEGRSIAECADQQATDRRPDGAADVDAEAVQRHCGREIRARYQVGYDGLPGRSAHGRRCAHEGRHHNQAHGANEVARHQSGEGHAEHHDRELAEDQQLASVDEVRERSRGQGEQKEGQVGCDLYQGHDQRIRVERGHQPTGCGRRYPAAQVGDDRGHPDHREGGMAECAPRQ